MKIGLVIERFDPGRGGVEQWTLAFARRLLADGHELHVVTRGLAGEARHLPLVPHELPVRGRTAFAQAAEEELSRLRLDVIHDTGCGWRCDVFQPHGGSWRAGFEQNQRLVPRWLRPLRRAAAGVLPRYREFQQLLARQYAADGRLFVALSRRVADDFVRYHSVDPARIRLVYNGVDTDRFSPAHRPRFRTAIRRELGVADHETLVLIVAHNFRLKGVPALVMAVDRLRQGGHAVRLAVVGGRRQPATSAVSFSGPCGDPVPYYAAADVYAQPTLYDPCSLVVLEAWASGLPVVTSRFNGAGELMQPGREGFLLDDPQDATELARCLESLLDPATRAAQSQAARALALRHTLAVNYAEMLAVYREQAGRGAAARRAA